MPRQYFAADAASAPSAAITWESSFTNVEVAFGQNIVTRVPNADPLRTTGLQGQGPDGSNLTLHLVNGPNGEQFVMTRNGNPMLGGSVAWVASGTPLAYPASTTWAPAGGMPQASTGAAGMQSALAGQSAADEKAMKTARTWLTVLGSLGLVVGILIALFSSAMADQVAKNPQLKNIDTSGLRVVGIVLAILGGVYVALARLAHGKRAKTMFLIGAIITGLNALANVAQMASAGATGLLGAGISGAAAYFCFKAYKVAKKLNS